MSEKIFCGVEGGASKSALVLINDSGRVICSTNGPSSNHLLVGIEECQKRLADMIDLAKAKAGISSDVILSGLGLCMSGCEEEGANQEFERNFMRKHPHISEHCTVASDAIGSLLTASPIGGLVLIAGTGSNSLVINPDGTTGRCGGWGHLIGDEGSAMWISLKAVKTVFDHEDNLLKCSHDISKVKELMLQHFKVTDKFGILEHCYANFDKSSYAGLCARLAEAACKDSDPLCCHLFYEAGKALASMVLALKPHVHKDLLNAHGGLPIVCVGSVFKSWRFLKNGFDEGMVDHYKEYTMLTLNCTSAVGAAYLGSQRAGHCLLLDFAQNVSILHHHKTE